MEVAPRYNCLYTVDTVDTVDSVYTVYTVDMVYTDHLVNVIDMVYTDDMVYTCYLWTWGMRGMRGTTVGKTELRAETPFGK